MVYNTQSPQSALYSTLKMKIYGFDCSGKWRSGADCGCVKAQLYQKCQLCYKPINFNDCIVRNDRGWVHVICSRH